jgi:hypothetical protein
MQNLRYYQMHLVHRDEYLPMNPIARSSLLTHRLQMFTVNFFWCIHIQVAFFVPCV